MTSCDIKDLKNMSLDEAVALCRDIREFLTENVVITGGHLASNLGIVEISVALLRVFSPPSDNIIYDTGHQSYVHKLLTGRMESFATLRTYGGLSGFTKRSESVYDPFGAGHCSTSVSAAIGISRAEALRGNSSSRTVAVIGDGAFSGGLVYEALNNVKENDRTIIVLNDNEMSISRNVGLMAGYLNKIRSKESYFNIKHRSEELISSVPYIGKDCADAIRSLKNSIKSMILKNNLFEQWGISYMGPADGNDLKTVETLFREAKRMSGPVLIHLHTKKGKGYLPAEEDPSAYHSVKASSHLLNKSEKTVKDITFTDNFGRLMTLYGRKNKRITAVTAAMCDGVGLKEFEKTFPERFFDVGIAEEHGMTFTAGMAAGGALPVFALYSTFFQRAYDQLFHDIALQRLKAVIALDRCGLVGEDGPTHHGLFDVSVIMGLPNVSLYSPATLLEQRYVFNEAFKDSSEECISEGNAVVIRYPKGGEDEDTAKVFSTPADMSLTSFCPKSKAEVLIVTYGRITAEAVKAARETNVKCAIMKILKLKPFDINEFSRILDSMTSLKGIVFLEEGIKNGGFSRYLLSEMAERGMLVRDKDGINTVLETRILAVEDRFVPQGKVSELVKHCSIDSKAVKNAMNEISAK